MGAMPVGGTLSDAPRRWLSRLTGHLHNETRSGAHIEYSPALIAYVATVTVTAAVILVTTRTPVDDWTAAVILSVAVFMLGFSSVEVILGLSIFGNASSLVNLGMAITFGPVGCVLSAFSQALGVATRLRSGWFRMTFNVGNFFLANWEAYVVFTWIRNIGGSGVVTLSVAGLAAGCVQYIGNSVLVAGVVAVATRTSLTVAPNALPMFLKSSRGTGLDHAARLRRPSSPLKAVGGSGGNATRRPRR